MAATAPSFHTSAQDQIQSKVHIDRKTWTEAFLKQLGEVPEGKDPAKDPELVRLVTSYTCHAVAMGVPWLDQTDPEMRPSAGVTREVLLARVRVLAQVLAEAGNAPGLAEIVNHVASWSEAEWRAYRVARAVEREAHLLDQKRDWSAATPKYLQAARCYRAIGREDRAGGAVNRAATGLCYMGEFRRAAKLWRHALALGEKIGNPATIAMSLGNLGNVFSSLGLYEKARDHYERALVLQEKTGDPADIASSLNNLGNVFSSLGQYEKAREYYERTLALGEKIGNPALNAGSLVGIGTVFGILGQYEKAREHYERALVLQEKIGNPTHIATSLNNLGNVFRLLGQYEQAREYYERTLALGEKIGNQATIAMSLHNLGDVFHSLGQYEKAREHHERALVLQEKIGNPTHIATSLNNLGYVFSLLGQYEKARERFDRALALVEKIGNPTHIATLLNNLGAIFVSLGQYEKARERFDRALALGIKAGNPAKIATSLCNLGNVFGSLGQYEKAREYHERALALKEKTGDPAGIASSLNNLGNVFHFLGQYEKARECFERALAFWKKTGNPAEIAASLGNLGNAYGSLGQYEKAREFYERALAIKEKIGNPAEIAGPLANLGIVFFSLGQYEQARMYFARALDNVRGVRERLLVDCDRVTLMEKWQWPLLPALKVALAEQAPEVVPDGSLALRVLEMLRGVATADLLQASDRGVRLQESGAAAGEVNRIEAEIKALENRVQKSYVKRGTGTDCGLTEKLRAELRARQRELEEKWQDAVGQLQRSSPEWANLKRPEAIGLNELQARLPKETAYFTFALGEDESILLMVDSNSLRHWMLPPRKTIEQAIRLHLGFLGQEPGARSLTSVVRSGRRLYDLLLGPAEDFVASYRTLVVSPEGILNGLPFGTLVPRWRDGDKAAFMVASCAILYVHSGTVWNLIRDRVQKRRVAETNRQTNRPRRILVLGDPIGPREAAWPEDGCDRQFLFAPARAGLGRLPHSRREALSIFEHFIGLSSVSTESSRISVNGVTIPVQEVQSTLARLRATTADERTATVTGPGAEVWLGRAASLKAFIDAPIEQFNFVHVAAHGYLNEYSPGLSGLVLSPSGSDSGFLRFTDIMNLRLKAEVVTLSGCNTAGGKPTCGEGFQGLVRAFLFAGAENVIAAAWRVPDKATAELLPGVYKSLLDEELPPVEALQQAKLRYLESVPPSTPEKAHPYYWGAWMLWGTGVKPEK